MEKNTHIHTIRQITGEILEVKEEIERNEDIGLTTKYYTFDIPNEVDPFIRGLIIQ